MQFDAPILYHFLESVDSTNTWVRLNSGDFDLTRIHVFHAAEQTQGKGTHGKSWVSPKDQNIYATFFFALPQNGLYSTLAQLLSLSIANTLKKMGFAPTIKWPNDVMLSHKKIGGILCEIVPSHKQSLIILGFGLNVNMPETVCHTINQPTSSLFAISQKTFSTNDLLYTIAAAFQKDFLVYLNQGFSPFTASYNEYMVYKDYPVVFNHRLLGISQSVNNQGALEVVSPSGETLALTYGSLQL